MSTREEARSPRRSGWVALAALALLLLILAAALWFWLARLDADADQQARQLAALVERQKELNAQLLAIGPPEPPICKAGEVLAPIAAPAAPQTPTATSS